MIGLDARPRLARKARLRHDRLTDRWLLVYPEAGLALSPTAAEVTRLCTGERTVAAIVDTLAASHADAPRATLQTDVLAFLDLLAARGLLQAA